MPSSHSSKQLSVSVLVSSFRLYLESVLQAHRYFSRCLPQTGRASYEYASHGPTWCTSQGSHGLCYLVRENVRSIRHETPGILAMKAHVCVSA